ncbi:hypothetical protein [Streptomyces sp. 6N223]|uniref:hypothetical protein n=1 Tax=Streptomyces sp. 6N223 TaxID=3457412 RepID=UPI003FD093DD
MTEWVPRFDYPASEEWLLMDADLPDAAERVAQQVAKRGGRRNKRYAKAVRGHLERTWARTREDRIEPLVVYVPHVWRDVPGFTPSSVYTRPFIPDHERTMEAIMVRARKPTDAPTEAEVTAVELPAGSACRVHERSLSTLATQGW